MQRPFFVLMLALAFSSVSASALADSAVVLTSLSDASEVQQRQAAAAARLELASHGYEVADASASRAIEDWIAATPCEECERDALRAHQLDVALVVMVWMPSRVRAEGQATVEMLDSDGLTVYGEANFARRADIPDAVRAAVAQAAVLFPHRAGVPITVEGLPEDAVVLIDNQPMGTLPYTGHLLAGEHRVSVFRQGFHSEERTYDVALTDEPLAWHVALDVDPAQAEVALAPPAAQAVSDDPSSRPHRLWWVGPTALGAVALGTGIALAVGVGRADPRADFDPNEAYERQRLSPGPAIALGVVGGLALVGAITWAVVGSADRRSTTEVSLGPGGLHLSTRF
jgi:hypothetical protein